MIFEHLVIGLVIVALGVVALKYNYQLVGMTGHIGFVENHFGYGSTYAFMKFMAILLCIGGGMYMFGLFSPFMTWLLSPIAHFFHPPAGI